MRITLTIDDDVLTIARTLVQRNRCSLDSTISD